MGIAYFLVGIYIVLCFWLIPKMPFIKQSNLTNFQIRVLLSIKILSAVVCAVYFYNSPTHVDYLANNAAGKMQYELLVAQPGLFFKDIGTDLQTFGFGGLFNSSNSFWAYLRFNLLFKFIAILNLLTHGNFFLNTIIFSTLTFFGHAAFYLIYSNIYKSNKLLTLLATFFLPSLLFYTSCIHKDGLVFLGIGAMSYVFYRVLSSQRSGGFKYGLIFLLGLLIVFLFRNFVIAAIVPAMLVAMLCRFITYPRIFVVVACYCCFFVFFFLTAVSINKYVPNLPVAVVHRKADFATLEKGNTHIEMKDLQPNLVSFVKNLPQAINHSLLRPYLFEFMQPAVFLTALELFMYQLIFLAFLFYRNKTGGPIHNFNIFGLAFAFNMMLIIGYTIPNIGAIVRYRSIFWVFLICPLVCNIDWRKLYLLKK